MTLPLHLLDTDTASFIIKARSPAIEATENEAVS